MINEISKNAENKMDKTIEAFRVELAKLRTGRAHPSLLDHVTVDYYGNDVPLSQTASINILDARTLAVVPWEKAMVQVIEKAIMTSDLGLNPATSGEQIRVPLPPLTEERRKEFIKIVKSEAENARVAIRNIRRDANHELKRRLKEKEMTEDEDRRGQDLVQKLTNKKVEEVEALLQTKEKDLLEI